jgi:hypothetical protein
MKKDHNGSETMMRTEYDFCGGERGKYAARFKEGTNLVAIEPDVRDVFPDSRSVNEALPALATVIRSRQTSAT